MKYQTRGVLAGAYRGGRANLKVLLTHTVDETDLPLCAVNPDSIADEYSCPEGADTAPTCKKCLSKDPRFKLLTVTSAKLK